MKSDHFFNPSALLSQRYFSHLTPLSCTCAFFKTPFRNLVKDTYGEEISFVNQVSKCFDYSFYVHPISVILHKSGCYHMSTQVHSLCVYIC